ncbi:phosphocholine cytidylyltransferase family protein [Candidatus Thioglobus sp.]|nr:phosphocholine cytidylyltransferase family protein [Candidatus Thioglobus sp.]
MTNNNKPKVILLVAGEGKRLRPFTLDRPKCMVEVDGISLIDRQLSILKSADLDNIVMIGGYKSHMLNIKEITLKKNPRYYETNMLWTLFSAEEELDQEVIISYGDIVYSQENLQALLNSEADISTTIDKNWEEYWRERNDNPLDDAETLKLREDGSISEIGQKPQSLNEIEGQYMGLMKFSIEGVMQLREMFHRAKKDESILGKPLENAYMTDILQALIKEGKMIFGVPVYGGWIEVDTVSDLRSPYLIKRLNSFSMKK